MFKGEVELIVSTFGGFLFSAAHFPFFGFLRDAHAFYIAKSLAGPLMLFVSPCAEGV